MWGKTLFPEALEWRSIPSESKPCSWRPSSGSDPADRRAFLDAEVGDDAELRDRLDALLAAYDRPPGALDRPLAADPEATDALDATRSVSSPPPGATPDDGPTVDRPDDDGPSLIDTIIAGRYKLRQEIGEGGMGTVYLAEQIQPVRRQVALKLIKPGMDSRNVLARFESERQALALMDHPNIAQVLDAGTTDDGRPFFVMELVQGHPAHRVLRRSTASTCSARLALFRQICSAVQHAHQKGIIHRDLKPTNILVESHDGKPVPKVIDFGLAKATSGHAADRAEPVHRLRHRGRHAAVHGARAGELQRAGRRHPGRHLRPGRDPLRAADRQHADRAARRSGRRRSTRCCG